MVHEQSGDTPRQTSPKPMLLYAPQTGVIFTENQTLRESVAQEVYGNHGNVYTKSDHYGNPTWLNNKMKSCL